MIFMDVIIAIEKRMTLLLIEELLRAPKVPVDRLNREAREFEDNVLSKIKKD